MLSFDPWRLWGKGWLLDEETREPVGVDADINRGNNNDHPHPLRSACHLLGTVLTALCTETQGFVSTFPRSQRQDFMST